MDRFEAETTIREVGKQMSLHSSMDRFEVFNCSGVYRMQSTFTFQYG